MYTITYQTELAKIRITAFDKPNYSHIEQDFYKAIRTKESYQGRLGGLYLNAMNLTNEQAFYFTNYDDLCSWRINENREPNNEKLYK